MLKLLGIIASNLIRNFPVVDENEFAANGWIDGFILKHANMQKHIIKTLYRPATSVHPPACLLTCFFSIIKSICYKFVGLILQNLSLSNSSQKQALHRVIGYRYFRFSRSMLRGPIPAFSFLLFAHELILKVKMLYFLFLNRYL